MRTFLIIIIILIILLLIPYLFSPIYDFPEPAPFSGNLIYNPYQNIDSTKWRKANFHTHARNIFGRISETKNIDQVIFDTYKKLGYQIIGISDYQNIDKDTNLRNPKYTSIPSYEHGYGVQKVHQLSVGVKKVLWLDYLFYQSIHQKQYIINQLKQRSHLVSINHPKERNAYSPYDISKLTNYDCIEVLNHRWFSLKIWDAALSSGHIAYILGDDDAHLISNPYEVGVCCNFLNSETLSENDILNAVKSGKSFGADVFMATDWTFDKKAEEAKKIAVVNNVNVKDYRLTIRLNEPAKKVNFIGQNGNIMKTDYQTNTPFYDILPTDTYIRTEITLNSGTVFYLNPVFRYTPAPHSLLPTSKIATVNTIKTLIYRTILLIVILSLFGLIIFIIKRKPKRKSLNS